MFIPPPILLVIAIALSYLLSMLYPAMQFTNVTFGMAGLISISLGFGLFLWAGKVLLRHKTTLHPRGKPKKLVTHGPYGFSRNPIYLGFFLISLGTALLFANVLAFVGPLIFFAFVSTLVIPFEEATLARAFGATYKKYRQTIRRWI